jgi:TupA-like ATPgrasp
MSPRPWGVRQWLRSSFGAYTLEWVYTMIPRRIVVEKLLVDGNHQVPSDYKFFVFNGTVRIIQVDFDRFVGHKRNLYDRTWNLLPVHYGYEHGPDVPRPANLDRMFDLAEKLARPFDFVRVDFYDVGGAGVFRRDDALSRCRHGHIRPTGFRPRAGFAVGFEKGVLEGVVSLWLRAYSLQEGLLSV